MVEIAKKSPITLAVNNHNVTQEPYVQHLFNWSKAIKPDHYVARRQAARECYRRQVSFMKFMRDCPNQRDKWKIDTNVFLGWLEAQEY